MSRLPSFYIPHGGGPCFDISWPDPYQAEFDRLGVWLAGLGEEILGYRPKAIVMVTAHWQTKVFSVSIHGKPGMLYDYTGFPRHTYQLNYDAPGSPELARQVVALAAEAGIEMDTDDRRGFDHGTFVPLRQMLPTAEIPVVQVSIRRDYEPAAHIAFGKALTSLRDQGFLILGSGMSFHNFDTFMKPEGQRASVAFDGWLTETVESEPGRRHQRLMDWEQAPFARAAHPQEDHLIPLMTIAGTASAEPGKVIFTGSVLGVRVSAYRLG